MRNRLVFGSWPLAVKPLTVRWGVLMCREMCLWFPGSLCVQLGVCCDTVGVMLQRVITGCAVRDFAVIFALQTENRHC